MPMVQQFAISRRYFAWMPLCTYLAYVILAGMHHYEGHNHHHQQKICDAATGERHIHSEEYAAVDCVICQIAPSVAEPSDFSFPEQQVLVLIHEAPQTCLATHVPVKPVGSTQPRAPPLCA